MILPAHHKAAHALAGAILDEIFKYDPDQPRDESGRWADNGSGNGGDGGGGSGGDGGGSTGGTLPAAVVSQQMFVAGQVASQVGVDPKTISYGGDGYMFEVGGEEFKAAGQYDPSNGEITLYDGALRDTQTVAQVTAHETQ